MRPIKRYHVPAPTGSETWSPVGVIPRVLNPIFDFFRTTSVAPWMGLGDHLVTIQVLEHPWGPM